MSIIRPGIIALLSILAVVAIFVFAHYDRQAKSYDEAAQRAAMRIHHLLAQQAQAQQKEQIKDAAAGQETPQEQLQAIRQARAGEPMIIDMEAVKQAGLKISPDVQLRAVAGPEGDTESIVVWHPKGIMEYVVTAKGVKTEYQ